MKKIARIFLLLLLIYLVYVIPFKQLEGFKKKKKRGSSSNSSSSSSNSSSSSSNSNSNSNSSSSSSSNSSSKSNRCNYKMWGDKQKSENPIDAAICKFSQCERAWPEQTKSCSSSEKLYEDSHPCMETDYCKNCKKCEDKNATDMMGEIDCSECPHAGTKEVPPEIVVGVAAGIFVVAGLCLVFVILKSRKNDD
jgi:hypothetical protein